MSIKLLKIPLRKTDDIDIATLLRTIINEEFYQASSSFEEDLQTLQSLRSKIAAPELTPEGLELHKKYFVQISTLGKKFHDDSLEFPWYGTLGVRVTGPAKIKSFEFEKINVLYNIGCILTSLALQEVDSDGDNLKIAYNYFQQAAGCFDELLKHLNFLKDIPLELSPDTILALKLLALAQAQEMFWNSAIKSGLKDTLISKLAFQVSDYYQTALTYMKKTVSFKSQWSYILSLKKFQFESSAHYRASLQCQALTKYGEEITHLQLSLTAVTSALNNKKYVDQEIVADLTKLENVVSDSLRRAERENDLIYLQEVPDKSSVLIEKTSMVSPKFFPELADPLSLVSSSSFYGPPLFVKLLPFTVIQVAQAFKERLDAFVEKNIKESLQMLTKLLNDFIHSKGLPASVDSVRVSQSIPASILQHAEHIKDVDGLKGIEEAISTNQKLAKGVSSKLAQCRDLLNIELKEDNLYRQEYGTKHWTRDPSINVSSQQRDTLNTLEQYIAQADDGDKEILRKITLLKPVLKIYEGGQKSLKMYVPYSNDSSSNMSPDLSRSVIAIDRIMKDAQEVDIRRNSFIKDVQIKSSKTSFLPLVISQYQALQKTGEHQSITDASFENVYLTQKKAFDVDLLNVQREKERQTTLESKIDEANDKFMAARSAHMNTVTEKREKSLKSLDQGYQDFCGVLENLKEGNQFYNDCTIRLAKAYDECRQFVEYRRSEAFELENNINEAFINISK